MTADIYLGPRSAGGHERGGAWGAPGVGQARVGWVVVGGRSSLGSDFGNPLSPIGFSCCVEESDWAFRAKSYTSGVGFTLVMGQVYAS